MEEGEEVCDIPRYIGFIVFNTCLRRPDRFTFKPECILASQLVSVIYCPSYIRVLGRLPLTHSLWVTKDEALGMASNALGLLEVGEYLLLVELDEFPVVWAYVDDLYVGEA